MYGYDLLTNHEYELICAYDDIYDEALEFLESMGIKGKLYASVLTRNQNLFEELYRDYQCDSVDSDNK